MLREIVVGMRFLGICYLFRVFCRIFDRSFLGVERWFLGGVYRVISLGDYSLVISILGCLGRGKLGVLV